jgi:hypothetical protein
MQGWMPGTVSFYPRKGAARDGLARREKETVPGAFRTFSGNLHSAASHIHMALHTLVSRGSPLTGTARNRSKTCRTN